MKTLHSQHSLSKTSLQWHYYSFVAKLEKHLPADQLESPADQLNSKGSRFSWSEDDTVLLIELVDQAGQEGRQTHGRILEVGGGDGEDTKRAHRQKRRVNA